MLGNTVARNFQGQKFSPISLAKENHENKSSKTTYNTIIMNFVQFVKLIFVKMQFQSLLWKILAHENSHYTVFHRGNGMYTQLKFVQLEPHAVGLEHIAQALTFVERMWSMFERQGASSLRLLRPPLMSGV